MYCVLILNTKLHKLFWKILILTIVEMRFYSEELEPEV